MAEPTATIPPPDRCAPQRLLALQRLVSDADGALPPWQRLWRLLVLERRDLMAVAAYAVGIGVLGLATPIAVQALIHTVSFATLLQPVVVLSLLLTVGLTFSALLVALQTWIVELLSRRVFLRVVADFAGRLPRTRRDVVPGQRGAALVNRFFDVVTIEKASAALLFDGLAATLQIATGLTLLAIYHPLLLVFDLLLILALGFVVRVLARGAVRTAVEESKLKYKTADWLRTVARHDDVFHSRSGADWAASNADYLMGRWLDARSRHFRVVMRQLIGLLVVEIAASAGLLALGGALVIAGQLSLGQLVAAEIVVAATVVSLGKLGKLFGKVYDLLAAVDKIGTVLDLPLDCAGQEPLPEDDGPLAVSAIGLRLRHPGDEACAPLDFAIAAGERVALRVGSGGRRRTLFDVLLGLRLSAGGAIVVGGVDVRDLDKLALREACVRVAEFDILPGPLRDNVAVGRPIDSATMRRHLDDVGLRQALARLPQGLDTTLRSDGAPLGRTEVALLLVARALAGRPRLLIVDRLLDGLPPSARDRLLRCLTRPGAGYTLLVATDHDEVAAAMDRTLLVGVPYVAPTAEPPAPDAEGDP